MILTPEFLTELGFNTDIDWLDIYFYKLPNNQELKVEFFDSQINVFVQSDDSSVWFDNAGTQASLIHLMVMLGVKNIEYNPHSKNYEFLSISVLVYLLSLSVATIKKLRAKVSDTEKITKAMNSNINYLESVLSKIKNTEVDIPF